MPKSLQLLNVVIIRCIGCSNTECLENASASIIHYIRLNTRQMCFFNTVELRVILQCLPDTSSSLIGRHFQHRKPLQRNIWKRAFPLLLEYIVQHSLALLPCLVLYLLALTPFSSKQLEATHCFLFCGFLCVHCNSTGKA